MQWLHWDQQFFVRRVLGVFLQFYHCRSWKTKSQGFELSDNLAGRFLMPLAVLFYLRVLCGDKSVNVIQRWEGLRFDVKRQVINSSITPHSPPPHPKFIILGKWRTNPCKALERERSLLRLINTVKSVLQQFSQYTVHDRNSFNWVNFIA